MRADRGQHAQIDIDSFRPGCRAKGTGVFGPAHFIQQFHQAGNDGIELEVFIVMRNAAQSLMRFPPQGFEDLWSSSAGGRLEEHRPDAPEPATIAFNAGAAPRAAHFPAAEEDQISPHRVCAVAPHQVIWGDHISAALAHFFAVLTQDHPLIAQLQHWFAAADNAAIAGGFVKKACVDQVHRGMF